MTFINWIFERNLPLPIVFLFLGIYFTFLPIFHESSLNLLQEKFGIVFLTIGSVLVAILSTYNKNKVNT